MLPGTAKSTALWAAALAALGGFAAVYVTLGRPDNASRTAPPGPAAAPSPAPAPAAPAPTASAPAPLPSGPGINPLSRGQMAGFVFRKEPEVLPEVKFLNAAGQELSLGDFRGKVVLLNLWATWCLPCRKEMPALDRLQAALGSDTFQVVAVSIDRTGLAGSKRFLDEAGITRLALYADPTVRMSTALRAAGLPATLLIDRQGREVGRLLGPAEWDGEDARRLIGAVLSR